MKRINQTPPCLNNEKFLDGNFRSFVIFCLTISFLPLYYTKNVLTWKPPMPSMRFQFTAATILILFAPFGACRKERPPEPPFTENVQLSVEDFDVTELGSEYTLAMGASPIDKPDSTCCATSSFRKLSKDAMLSNFWRLIFRKGELEYLKCVEK